MRERYLARRYCGRATVSRGVGLFICVLLQLGTNVQRASAADALTQHYNNARTGATLTETILKTSNVKSATFGKLWTLYADGQIVAQPLYVSALHIDTTGNTNAPLVQGTFNAVILATMHNTVYVYDADKENPGPQGHTVPLWATWLGQPRPGSKSIDMWSTNDPEWGILSTPVISPDKTTIFVAAWHDEGPAGLRYRLHALNLQNGTHRMPAVAIGPSSTDASNPCKAQNAFNPCVHKQRAALLLAGGVVYVAFGGDGNRGALFAFDAQTLAQRAFWSSTPTGTNGGLWQSGQGPAADADGSIYMMTGNGSFNANTAGGQNFGNSLVKLKLEGQNFVVKDFFTPCNQAFLNNIDLDLGSGGPVLLPGTPARIVGGGKEGVVYVLSRANLGKYAASPTAPNCHNANAGQEVRVFDVPHNGETHYPNIHGSPVFWKGPDASRIYVWPENNPLKAFIFSQGRIQNPGSAKASTFRPPIGMPGGMLVLSANGSTAGTGIVWAVVPLDGDANRQRGVKGIVLALDAQDVTKTLWTSEQFSQRDRLGLFAKFNPPLVANGKLFVPTYGNDEPRREYPKDPTPIHPTTFPQHYYVAVYGLLKPTPGGVIVNQDRDDVSLIRAATTPLSLPTTNCVPIDTGSVDCTDALAATAGSPSFHRIVVAANQTISGCSLLRITTASKNTGLANSTGIGFWSAQAAEGNQAPEDSGRFVPKSALKAVGNATLRGGAPATLHEFVGLANCAVEGGGEPLKRLLKPYMQFDAADGRVFRNWDRAENYEISVNVPSFDRSSDVLQP